MYPSIETKRNCTNVSKLPDPDCCLCDIGQHQLKPKIPTYDTMASRVKTLEQQPPKIKAIISPHWPKVTCATELATELASELAFCVAVGVCKVVWCVSARFCDEVCDS